MDVRVILPVHFNMSILSLSATADNLSAVETLPQRVGTVREPPLQFISQSSHFRRQLPFPPRLFLAPRLSFQLLNLFQQFFPFFISGKLLAERFLLGDSTLPICVMMVSLIHNLPVAGACGTDTPNLAPRLQTLHHPDNRSP
jgi:hypothetical protein